MNVYTIGVIGFFILFMGIGKFAGSRIKGTDDYYVSGRNAPTFVIVGTLVACYASTVAFLGESGFSYNGYPVLLLILMIFNVLGYTLGGLFFGRFLRRSACYTLPEYFGSRFASRKVRKATGWITVLGIGAYLVAVTQGAAMLLTELLQLDYVICLPIVSLLSTLFTFYSGSRGVLMVNTVKFLIIMIIASIGGWYIMNISGGWSEAIGRLAQLTAKPGLMSWHGVVSGPLAQWPTPFSALAWAVSMGITWAAVVAVGPWEASLYLMARNEHVTIRASMCVPIFLLLFYFLLQFSAAGINLINPDLQPPERAYIWAAFNVMPAWMGILLLGGIMTVALSACSTFLNLVGLSFTRDILGQEDPDARTLRLARVIMLGVGLTALIICFLQPPAIMWIGYFAASIFGASWGPVAFLSVWSKRITEDGAFWGVIGGAFMVVAGQSLIKFGGVSFPPFLQPSILGLLTSAGLTWFISLKGSPSPEAMAFHRALHADPPADTADPKLLAGTLRLARLVVGVGLLMSVAVMYFYVRPYLAVTGLN